MITAPDVVALTREDDYGEQYSEEPAPPFQFQPENPWSKTATAKFEKDFILISEFSEQVGPQPLLTIPDNARGNFDLNYFSLRIMSVDYQASFVGHPPGTSYPKLNFVEDSKVVLGDSKEGAFAYVHHLTLYDLEARGFVRPFCVAYISMDENKIMQQFQELSDDFSKASECLKTGNRKAFANELEKKLQDLEYTRNVLHNETEIQKKSNDKGYYSSVAIEKANELANVEKCIIEHQDLLTQIRNYSYKKTRDVDYFSYEPDNGTEHSDSGLEQLQNKDELCEKNNFSDRSYIPKFTKAKSAKCFEKKLKTLEELCDSYYFNQTLEQLRQVEKFFRGDVCYLLTSQIEKVFLQQQQTTSFLFEDPLLFAGVEQTEKEQHCEKPLPSFNIISAKVFEHPCLSNESTNCESYKSCVESVPIKLDQQISVENYHGTMADSIPCKNPLGTSDYLELEGKEKGSISSGESIEVLGTEKSCPAPVLLSKSDNQPNSQSQHLEVVRRKFVGTKRTNSEDSIEVLSTTESLIPEDLKPIYPNAIHEEEPPLEDEEIGMSTGLLQPDANPNHANQVSDTNFENKTITLSVLSEPVDPSCCIGKESPHFTKSVPTFITEEYSDEVVNVPPQRSKTIGQIFHSDYQQKDDGGGLHNTADQVFSACEKEYSDLPGNEETAQIPVDEYLDNMSYISASLCSDRTPSPALPTSPSKRPSGKRKKHSGKNSLWFIRQYSFAQQAIFSLLSGRTLVVVGEHEGKVKKLVNALSIFVPNYGRDADSVKQWITFPLHVDDLQTWKLIGLQRIASPLGTSMLHSLNRYSRYISILDCDNKTLRCPQYKGQLITRLADHRTQIKRGSTYYMHVHNMLTQLCSQAFLYTFCHHLHLPIDERESEESVTYRRVNFLKHHLGLMNDDSKIVQYFSELIKMHYLHEPPKGLNPVLRFNYIPSVVFKI